MEEKNLEILENKSIYIIREAYKKYKNMALLWSIGKDSTALLWLCKKAFYGKIPFPVIHIDTSYKFPEIYKFRDKYAKEWGLNLIIAQNKEALRCGMCPEKGKFECCTQLKTEALKQCLRKHKFDALLLAIRRDEHGIRAKERYFSPRDRKFRWRFARQKNENEQKEGDSPFVALQDTELSGWDLYGTDFGPECHHVRVHPILHWSELDIWEYIKKEKIPTVELYFAKKTPDGRSYRYRSIGCETCCNPVLSSAKNKEEIIEELKTTKESERAVRAQDKVSSYMI